MISYSQAQSRAGRIDGKPSICIFKMGSSLIPKKLATNCDGVAMTDVPQKLFWEDVSLPDAPCPHIAGNDTGACGTCPHGDNCIFLHDEKPLPAVLYGGKLETVQYRTAHDDVPSARSKTPPLPLGSETDVRIYVRNIPPEQIVESMSNQDWLRELASSYGPVSMVELIPSTIASGRLSGFIHMSYEVQADNFIKQFCNISINKKCLFAKKEEVRALMPQRVLPRQPSVPKPRVTVDEEGYATHVSQRRTTTTASTAVARVAAPAPVGQFALLMDEEDDEEDEEEDEEDEEEEDEEEEEEEGEEEDFPPPLERVEEEDLVPRIEGKVEDSPFSVIGLNPWSNSDRRMTMCNELATMRQNEVAEKKALMESRTLVPTLNYSSRITVY
eukprot:gene13787-4888_t